MRDDATTATARCPGCKTEVQVGTRAEYATFEESHTRDCGITPEDGPFGDVDELMALPPS